MRQGTQHDFGEAKDAKAGKASKMECVQDSLGRAQRQTDSQAHEATAEGWNDGSKNNLKDHFILSAPLQVCHVSAQLA